MGQRPDAQLVKRKHLWLVDECAFANGWLGSTARHFALARMLSSQGWEVSVITPRRRAPALPADVIAAFPGAVVVTPFTAGPCPPGFDHRVLARVWVMWDRTFRKRELFADPELQWASKMEPWLRSHIRHAPPPDVVWGVTYGGVHALTAARRLAGAASARLVVAIHDPVPQPGRALNEHEDRALRRVLDDASAVVVTTATYARTVAERFPQVAGKIRVVYASYSAADEPSSRPPQKDTLCRELELLLAGSIYQGQNAALSALVRGLARFAQERPEAREGLRLRVVGAGAGASSARELALVGGVPEMIVVEPQLSPSALRDLLATTDCLVVLGWDEPVQIPGKLFRYLAARKPILGILSAGEAAEILRRTGLGILATPEDPESMIEALRRLWLHRGRLGELARPDQEFIQEFSEERIGEKVLSILEEGDGHSL